MRFFITLLLLIVSIHSRSQIVFESTKKNIPVDFHEMWFRAAAIGDIDNDGRNDLIVGSWYDNYQYPTLKILIFKQLQNGTLSSPEMLDYPRSSGVGIIQIADINNDHLNDILIGYGDSIGIFYQTSPGTLGKIQSIYSGTDVDGLKTGDLNNDGLTDIAVSHWNVPYIKVFIQNANGSLSAKSFSVTNAGYDEIDIADVNGDKLDDIVFMPGQFRNATLQILYQRPNTGISNSVFLYKYPGEEYTTYHGIGIGDLNDDGKNDIVGSFGLNDGSIILMYQDNNGRIDNIAQKLPALDIPTPVEIEDLNCDGKNEIIVGHNGWASVTVYEKDQLQQFNKYTKFTASPNSYRYSMAVGDLNNDNLKDIVTVDDFSDIRILYNRSKPKTFDKSTSFIKNISILSDTITTFSNFTTQIIDPSANCKVNRDLYRSIIKKTKREFSTGDSVTIRQSTFCGCTDTIISHFNYTVSYDLSIDTVDTIINKDILSASLNSILLDAANSSTKYLSVSSNICWNVISDQDWLIPSINTGNGDTSIGLTASTNHSVNERKAIVTLTGLGMSPIEINVTQSGFIPVLTVTPLSIVINDKSNNKSNISISSNVNWNISIDTPWLSVDKNGGEDDDLISLNALPNNTTTDRVGTITITGADTIVRTIEIIQHFSADLPQGRLIEITLFPNPAQNKLIWQFTNYTFEGLVEIFDVKGDKLSSHTIIKGISEINIEHLVSGMYFLKFHLSKGYIVQKFIKV